MFTKIYSFKKFIALSVIMYFIMSLLGLRVDVLNTDGINWHTRSANFVDALFSGDLKNTYQSYHPGITLMWVSGPVLRVVSAYFISKGFSPYSFDTYLVYDFIAKLSLIVFTAAVFLYLLRLLNKIVQFRVLLMFSVLMIFEPFILGQRRLYHLDYLMTILIFASFVSAYYFVFINQSRRYLIISALFLILGVLTKSSGAIFFPIPYLMFLFSKHTWKTKITSGLIFSVMLIVFTYVFIPALWGNPIRSTRDICKKVSGGAFEIGYIGKKDIGFSGSKENVTLDEVNVNGTYGYYIKALAYTLSPVTAVFVTLSLGWLVVSVFKKQPVTLEIFCFLTIILFTVIMSISSKKGLRYGVVLYPFMFLMVSGFLSGLKVRLYSIVLSAYLFSLIPQYIQIHPYYYAYADPLLGGVKSRVEVFKPGSLGVATYAINERIRGDAGKSDYKVSANKSLKVISPKGRVNTSLNCESDYLVVYYLDTDRIQNCGAGFIKLDSIKVGNLNYWDIYKRQRT